MPPGSAAVVHSRHSPTMPCRRSLASMPALNSSHMASDLSAVPPVPGLAASSAPSNDQQTAATQQAPAARVAPAQPVVAAVPPADVSAAEQLKQAAQAGGGRTRCLAALFVALTRLEDEEGFCGDQQAALDAALAAAAASNPSPEGCRAVLSELLRAGAECLRSEQPSAAARTLGRHAPAGQLAWQGGVSMLQCAGGCRRRSRWLELGWAAAA
jgi:hypothetical protein